MTVRPLELLAPAKNADIAIRAIMAGADAIYIGPESHGARKSAANSIADIRKVAETAHRFGARVYATVNTIVFDNELEAVEKLVWDLWQAGTDALIVQDMALLRMHLPPIELHASTQCDIRTPEKARFLAAAGFSRLVLPRELSLGEIEEIHKAVPDTELEAFVHGALCVSYSGDCRASAMAGGRSANRGECAQICRLPYNLTDARGNILVEGKHLLSLRDMNRIDSLGEMARAGVMSFKIEGRLKEADYVANAVASYSARLDRVVAESGGDFRRLSWGRAECSFTPDPAKAFNRGFTSYFLNSPSSPGRMASIHTPKSIGSEVGRVVRCTDRFIEARLSDELANGDGLGYFDRLGRFCGFRLNRVEGNRLFPASPQRIKPGTVLWRNRSQQRDAEMKRATCARTVGIGMALRYLEGAAEGDHGRLVLDLRHEAGFSVSVARALPAVPDAAVSPQEAPRRRVLSKLGDTIYRATTVSDLAGPVFIPPSLLTSLRRDGVDALDRAVKARHPYSLRRPEQTDAPLPSVRLDIHDNVANHLAREFYLSHGAESIVPAVEVERPTGETNGEIEVMCTRYCLRREMGRCLKTSEGKLWQGPLYLESDRLRMRVDFDCKRCGMNLSIVNIIK